MQGVRGGEDDGAAGVDGRGLAAVDDLGGEQSEPGVPVVMVVGVEEAGAESAGSLLGGEGAGCRPTRPMRTMASRSLMTLGG